MKSGKTCTLLNVLTILLLTLYLSSFGHAEARGVTKDSIAIGFIGDMTVLQPANHDIIQMLLRHFFGT